MKLLSYVHSGQTSFGVVKDGGIIDLKTRIESAISLRQVLTQNPIDEIATIYQQTSPDIAIDQITYLPPVPDPEKIICIGVNYKNRNEEYKDKSATPKYPSVFMRTRESIVGHNEAIVRPPESDQLDYEGEIAMIIGKEGRRISQMDAHLYIAGFTLMNEGSIRDWLRHAKFNVTQGKNFERTASVGPYLVTRDEIENFDDLRLTTRVNGEQRQNGHTRDLMFSFRYLVSYLSTFMRLKPGDIISTGTPLGAGVYFDPPKFLKPDDVVEIESPEIGVLRNHIVDEIV